MPNTTSVSAALPCWASTCGPHVVVQSARAGVPPVLHAPPNHQVCLSVCFYTISTEKVNAAI